MSTTHMVHQESACPLCQLNAWLEAFAKRWELVGPLPQPQNNPFTRSEPLYGLGSSIPLLTQAKPLLMTLATSFDKLGITSSHDHGFKGLVNDRWKPSASPEEKSSVITKLSECANTAEFLWTLLGGHTGRQSFKKFCGQLPSDKASYKQLDPKYRLGRKQVPEVLARWEREEQVMAQLGLVTPGPNTDYSDDHTFIIAKYKSHYALYQSWVGRFFLWERPRQDEVSLKNDPELGDFSLLIPDLWDMNELQFSYVLQNMAAKGALRDPYRNAMFNARTDPNPIHHHFRYLEAKYDASSSLKTLKNLARPR